MFCNNTIQASKNIDGHLLYSGLLFISILLLSLQADASKWTITGYSPQTLPTGYLTQLTLQGSFSQNQGGREVRISQTQGAGPEIKMSVISWSKNAIVVNVINKFSPGQYWFKIYNTQGNHIVTSSTPLEVTGPYTLAEEGGSKRNTVKNFNPALAGKLGAGLPKPAPQPMLKPQALGLRVKPCADGFSMQSAGQGQYKCISKTQSCKSGYQAQPSAHYDATGKRLYYFCKPE